MGAGRSAVFFRVLLPAALPYIIAGQSSRSELLARAGRRGDARRHRLRLGLRSSRHGRSSTPRHLCRHHHDRDPRHDPGEGSLRVPRARHGRSLGHGPVRFVMELPPAPAKLRVEHARKQFDDPPSAGVEAIRDASLEFGEAESAPLIGPSGCGKVDASLSRGRFPTALRRHALARREAHHRRDPIAASSSGLLPLPLAHRGAEHPLLARTPSGWAMA